MSDVTVDRDDLAVLYRAALGEVDRNVTERIRMALDRPPRRTPVCAEDGCGTSIEFVPRSGWGATGEWQHVGLPRNPGHIARPRVFVTPPRIPNGFLGA